MEWCSVWEPGIARNTTEQADKQMLLWGAFAPLWGASTAVSAGASSSKRGRKRARNGRYPRRVYIDGQAYWVNSIQEERDLLQAHRDRLREAVTELESAEAPPAEVKKAQVKVVRVERRIEKTVDREAEWLDRLRQEDDELLTLLH